MNEMIGQGKRYQRGLGLIETMLITFLISGALIAGYAALSSKQASLLAAEQGALLNQADRHLMSFITSHNRMPCPDTTGDGYENCGGSEQKGSLPYKTLRMDLRHDGQSAAQLMYMVQRGAVDLTVASNHFEPLAWGGSAYNAHHSLDNIELQDVCQGLQNAHATPFANHHAHLDGGSDTRPVAYAIAHPGRSSGFNGINASADAVMYAPEFRPNSNYDDRVLARGYQQLASELDCVTLMASINYLSMAADLVDEVNSQKVWTTVTASVLTGLNVVKSVIQTVKVGISLIALGTAVTYLATATAELAASIASCVIIVGCANIPKAAAAVAASAVAVAAASVAVAANIAATVAHISAYTITLLAAIRAGAVLAGEIDLSDAIADAYEVCQDAGDVRSEAYDEWQEARDEEADAYSDMRSAWSAMLRESRDAVRERNRLNQSGSDWPSNRYEHWFESLRDHLDNWQEALKDVEYAKERIENAASEIDAEDPDFSDAIDELNKLIDEEEDPAVKEELENARDDLIERSNTPTDSGEMRDELMAQIEIIDGEIDELAERIDEEEDEAVRQALIEQRTQLIEQRDVLQAELDKLDTDMASLESNLRSAEQLAEQREDRYELAVKNIYDAHLMHYRICSTDDDGNETCVSRYLDRRSEIFWAMMAFQSAYEEWWVKGEGVRVAKARYDQALDNERAACDAHKALVDIDNDVGDSDAEVVHVWDGAEVILDLVDERGGKGWVH